MRAAAASVQRARRRAVAEGVAGADSEAEGPRHPRVSAEDSLAKVRAGVGAEPLVAVERRRAVAAEVEVAEAAAAP